MVESSLLKRLGFKSSWFKSLWLKVHGSKVHSLKVHGWRVWGWTFWGWKFRGWNVLQPDSKYIMAKIGMNENKVHVDEIHNIRSGSSVYSVVSWSLDILIAQSAVLDHLRYQVVRLRAGLDWAYEFFPGLTGPDIQICRTGPTWPVWIWTYNSKHFIYQVWVISILLIYGP